MTIAKPGKPLVRLVPFVQEVEPGMPGKYQGKVQIPADFNGPNEDKDSMFHGE